MSPSDMAAAIEREAHRLTGPGDRFHGYGVMGLGFAGGDVLAMRRFPSTSGETAYTSVWHRTRDGRWTFYCDVGGGRGCTRYFGAAIAETVVTPIRLEWLSARRLIISIDSGRLLVWSLCVVASVRSRLLTTLAPVLPGWCWKHGVTRRPLESLISAGFRAGRVCLAGPTPSGHRYIVRPCAVWQIGTCRARLCGRDLGTPAPLPQQAALGGFWIPQRGLFMAGEVEMHDPLPPLPRA